MFENKYILSLIENKISLLNNDLVDIENKYSNISFFQLIIDKLTDNDNYKFTFIGDINNSQLENVLLLIDNSEEKSLFKASIMSIRGTIDINKASEKANYKYDDNQIDTINKLIELIKRKIAIDNERYLFEKENINNLIKKLSCFRDRLVNGIRLELEDFDLAEDLLKENSSSSNKASVIIKYLSIYNLNALEGKKEVTYNPFEFNEIIKEKSNEKLLKLKAACKTLGLVYDKLYTPQKGELLKVRDINTIVNFAGYLKEKGFDKDISLLCLCTILGNSTLKCFKETVKILEELNFKPRNIKSILRLYPLLFTLEGYNSLKGNIVLLDKYNVEDKSKLYKSSLFLLRNPDDNKAGLEEISKYISIRDLFLHVPVLFNMGYDLIINNINILLNYGYTNLDIQNPAGYTLLGAVDLQLILDRLIELGLNDYIHEKPDDSIKMTKSLVIKRVFFSSKNKISAWKNDESMQSESLSTSNVNRKFESIVLKHRRILTESEISELNKKYPILEELDVNHRPVLYSENNLEKLRRKTELKFGNKIVSRQKVYSVFKAIVESIENVDEKEVLLYSICYNSLLDQSEYELFKKAVYKDKMLGAVIK